MRRFKVLLHLSDQLTYAFFCNTVLDESAQTLFLTEMFRGLSLTLRAFFDRKVTVSPTVPIDVAMPLADHSICVSCHSCRSKGNLVQGLLYMSH